MSAPLIAHLLAAVVTPGPYRADPKKTSIHLARTVDFAGVHPRQTFLILNLRKERPIDCSRVATREQVSKNRYHNEIMLSSPAEVGPELVAWLCDASAPG